MNPPSQRKDTEPDMQQDQHRAAFAEYRAGSDCHPLFLHGDAAAVLDELPAESFDCAMTRPPYWGQRSYAGGGIGLSCTIRVVMSDFAPSPLVGEGGLLLPPPWWGRAGVGG